MRGRNVRFCASEPCRSSVPMLYIWPSHAPELPPQRLISSMMTDASASPRPEPPYSCGISAASQPALVSASTERLRIAARLVDLAEIGVGKPLAQRAHAVAD